MSASVPVPVSVVAESRTINNTVPSRPGLLTIEQFEAIAPSVRALRADPAELSLFVGDTIRIADDVRILGLDSMGVVLGELPYYDFTYTGRGFRLLADGRVRINRTGTVMFTARLSARHWQGRDATRPSVRVPLLITGGAR